jgi:predicted DNA-binding protein YlxM (UPF0122 family)
MTHGGGRDEVLADLIRREDILHLRHTLNRLSESDRRVLQLYYIENLAYAEISRRLSISVNTVGPKLHRAQQRLKRLLHSKLESTCHDSTNQGDGQESRQAGNLRTGDSKPGSSNAGISQSQPHST